MANKGWPRSKCITELKTSLAYQYIQILYYVYIEQVVKSNSEIAVMFSDDNAVTNDEVKL
jgi:hypothetical protein